MAYIAKTAFEARITNNEFEELANVAGKYQESSADVVCSAGMLCVRNGQLDCQGFSGVKNENAWKMNAATSSATAADCVYACDTHEVNVITDPINGAQYAVGTNTLGLPAPKGRICNFCRIYFDGDHVYRFGEGNIDGTLGTKTILSIDDGLLKPETAAPQTNGALYFEIIGTGKFVEGASQSFTYYDVVAKRVIA